MKVVVLCSGGMDSVTALYRAHKEHEVAAVIGFDYGSKHNHRELPFAEKHAKQLGVRYEQIPLEFINRLFDSDLLKSGGEIPEGHYEAENMKQTVVPFRNAIMLSIACGFAESVEAEGLVIAAHAMLLGTYDKIKLLRPFIEMSKADIAQEGTRLGIDFAQTWSCYQGGEKHCGKCGTCVERREAFSLAGINDPTVYAETGPLPSC